TGGVDQETSGEPNTPSSSLAFDHDASLPGFDSRDRRLVEILDPRRLRLADEKVIEVGAIPVRVGDFIVGARGDEELVAALRVAGKGRAGSMAVKSEPAFQTDGKLGMRTPPAPPCAQGANFFQTVPITELLEQEIGEWR